MTVTCGTPGCSTQVRGRKWCAKHQKLYDRIREEVSQNQRNRLYGPRKKGRPKKKFRCEFLDCSNYAKPGERFCIHHLRLRATSGMAR